MSTPPQHEDRHSHCGGLWIGGICTRCQAECQCAECCASGALTLECMGITPGPQPTRAMQPEDVRPGKWSEFDGEADD